MYYIMLNFTYTPKVIYILKKFEIRTERPTKNKPTQLSGFLYYCKISFLLTTTSSVIISKKL